MIGIWFMGWISSLYLNINRFFFFLKRELNGRTMKYANKPQEKNISLFNFISDNRWLPVPDLGSLLLTEFGGYRKRNIQAAWILIYPTNNIKC